MDGDGKLCGLNDYSDYKYLYYIVPKTSMDFKAVCVQTCPVELNDAIDCKKTSRIASTAVCQ